MRVFAAILLTVSISGALTAQVITDRFNYAGTSLGPWQEVRGDWTANGTEGIAPAILPTSCSSENKVAGSVGIVGSGSTIIDDFKYYDGIVVDAGQTNPGSAHRLTLHGTPNPTYQAACALGNTGFPIGAGRRLPLDPDPMFFASTLGFLPAVFQSFGGVMDANGQARITVNVPPDNALIGLHWFTGFVNIGGAGITTIGAEASTEIL